MSQSSYIFVVTSSKTITRGTVYFNETLYCQFSNLFTLVPYDKSHSGTCHKMSSCFS